jgi:hypothetical protein
MSRPFEQLETSTYERATRRECLRHAPPPPPVHVLHELHWDVGRIALARHQQSICQLPRHQALATYSMPRRTDHVGVITMKRLDQGNLHPKLEVPGLTCPGLKSNLGLHGGRRALEKSHSNSLLKLVLATI